MRGPARREKVAASSHGVATPRREKRPGETASARERDPRDNRLPILVGKQRFGNFDFRDPAWRLLFYVFYIYTRTR